MISFFSFHASMISIHAPRVGSDLALRGTSQESKISIHAPRVGSDLEFLLCIFLVNISIHAPRVGSDQAFWVYATQLLDFNPRSPRGERHHGHQQNSYT